MKRTLFAIMAALCCLTMSAQDGFKVKFEGVAPDIMDFALAYFTFMDDDPENTPDEWMNGVRKSLQCYLTGDEQPQGFTITVDKKAGYILIKQTDKDGEFTHRYEMCYWNMADQKHKLFALNVELWQEGMRLNPGQYDGLMFWRYDNAKKWLTPVDMGIKMEYFNTSYGLPRTGKDITVTKWNEATGKKTTRTLKWNGRGFGK
jgi:hypothetical protein